MNVSKKYPPMLAVAQMRELELIQALGAVRGANEQIANILNDQTSSEEMRLAKIACLVRVIAEQCDKGLKKV